jgi:hypothetical protein
MQRNGPKLVQIIKSIQCSFQEHQKHFPTTKKKNQHTIKPQKWPSKHTAFDPHKPHYQYQT